MFCSALGREGEENRGAETEKGKENLERWQKTGCYVFYKAQDSPHN